jgi:hypothetical protein
MDETNRVELERVEEFQKRVMYSTSENWTFDEWLSIMEELQQIAYGAHYDDFDPQTRGDSAMMNLFALVSETVEMGEEIGWKPWASPRGWVNRDAIIREAVDLMHFLANMLKHANATGYELTEAYKAKVLKNLQRQIDGYDVRVEKCEWCHTDLSEHTLTQYTLVRDGIEHKFCKHDHAVAWQAREDR